MKFKILLLIFILSAFSLLFSQPVQAQLRAGDPAPEILLPDASNVNRSLSSLKGNVVLVYFWASWDPASRANSPNVIALYNKYEKVSFPNAGGFKLLSVSLDSDRKNWINTLNADKLPGTYHVYDFYSGSADTYKVQQLPYSFLIDANGAIYAVNPSFIEIDRMLAVNMKATQTMAFQSNVSNDQSADARGNAAVTRSAEIPVTQYNQPTVTTETKAEGVSYRVQIGAYKKVNLADFNRVAQYGKVTTETTSSQVNRVLIGNFDTKSAGTEALYRIQKDGYPDAFLVEYKNNARVRVLGKGELSVPATVNTTPPAVNTTTATTTPAVNPTPNLPATPTVATPTVTKPGDNTPINRSPETTIPANIFAVPTTTPGTISTTMPEPFISAPYTLPVTTSTQTQYNTTTTTTYTPEKTVTKNPSVNTTTANPTNTAIQPYKPGDTRFSNSTAPVNNQPATTTTTTTTTTQPARQQVPANQTTTQPVNKPTTTTTTTTTQPATTATTAAPIDPNAKKQLDQEMLDKQIDGYINNYDFSTTTNTKSNRLKNKLKRDKKKR